MCHLLYIANHSRCGFCGPISTTKLFQWNSLCNKPCHAGLPSNYECFPVNYSLVLQPQNFSILNDLQYMVLQWNVDVLNQKRIYNKRRKGEYSTFTMPGKNVLRKVRSVNHRVLSFCINTLRETKDSLIGVNSVVLGITDTR